MLRKLGHVTKEGLVTLKGRAACEISTGDELLTTELMFNSVFNSLDKHQLVALISCLVPVEKSNVSLLSLISHSRVSYICPIVGSSESSHHLAHSQYFACWQDCCCSCKGHHEA